MSKKFKVNDEVYLTNNSYYPTKTYPVKDSKYACIGTVINVLEYIVEVYWDNGETNVFPFNDLTLADTSIENCNSIW